MMNSCINYLSFSIRENGADNCDNKDNWCYPYEYPTDTVKDSTATASSGSL